MCRQKRRDSGFCARAPSVPHRFKETATEAKVINKKTLTWPRRWYLPLNASKSHRLSLREPLDLRLAEYDLEGKTW